MNGDDPEAVVHAAKWQQSWDKNFKDAVIDIFCYRRFGHNEGDEPMFTNPSYNKIKNKDEPCALYRTSGQRWSDPRGRNEDLNCLSGAYERRIRSR